METKLIELYKNIAKIPDIKNAEFLNVFEDETNYSLNIQVTFVGRDLSSLDLQESIGNYTVQNGNITFYSPNPTSKTVLLSRMSPSGTKTAQIIKENSEEKVLIIGTEGSVTSINLTKVDLHGKVYGDPYLSCLEWSSDDKKIVFIAESKKSSAFCTSYTTNDEELTGKQYEFIDDWGEQLIGQSQGVVVEVDIESEIVSVFDLPENLTPGQLTWVPNTYDVVGVAYPSEPFRLGLAYSSDRESFLFLLDSNGSFSELTPRGQQTKCPRFSPLGDKLIFLTSATFGLRAPTSKLASINWKTKETTILVDYIHQSMKTSDQHTFYGICGKTILPKRCFDSSGKNIIFSAFHRNDIITYIIDSENCEIKVISADTGCNIAVDVKDDWILLIKSAATQLPHVLVSRFDSQQPSQFIPITKQWSLQGLPKNWCDSFDYQSPVHDDDPTEILNLSSLYIGPPNIKESENLKRPLICIPHGGPHSIIPNKFHHGRAFLVMAGYSLILPNYRGSVGHGEDIFSASIGHLGLNDITDCYLATKICCERFQNVVDEANLYLMGYSHGGLISVFLAVKHPKMFNAICLQNAPLDLNHIAVESDIPEWAYLEFGLPYNIGRSLDATSVSHLFKRSPLSKVEEFKTPTLIMSAKEDIRIPLAQSKNFHRMLLARNIPSKLLIYEDNHSLSRISSEFDSLIQIVLWLKKYS